MHVDLQEVDSPRSYRAPVCIIGAGVAGILLARSLSVKGIEVHLIEGGGMELEESSQDLYKVKLAGLRHSGASEGRFRAFGGTSIAWGAQMLPYTEDVIHPPAELGLPDWAVELHELEPYYDEVQSIFEVSRRPFTQELLHEFDQSLPFASDDVRLRFSKWAPFSRRNLARTLGQECLTNQRVSVFTHATVTSIELNESGGAVRELMVANDKGGRFRFSAEIFVLCAGTIESSRLLLVSTNVASAGIGNDRDLVGRYFHDHIGVKAAEVSGENRGKVVECFAPFISGRTLHTPKLEATARLRQRNRLLSVMAHFPVDEPDNSGVGAIRGMLKAVQQRRVDRSLVRDLMKASLSSAEILQLAWSAKVKGRRALSNRATISLHIDCEQKPRADSRIRLGDDRDRLGMRICVVDWKISEEEHDTVRKFSQTINEVLRQGGISGFKWYPEICEPGEGWLARAVDTFHMMGGTRMGSDPASGVVDANLQVHGIPNLYIASCSTFPTGGSSNPTFTLMAMTLRLRDRIVAL